MRFYDLLLHLYPVSFRNEYGAEMRAVFARERRHARGMRSALTLWSNTVADIIGNALLAHVDILRQDLSHLRRSLRRSPGFAATAVLLVALGIGATTAAFSVADFVLLRPLPFADPERLVTIYETTPGYPRMEFSPPNYRDWTGAAQSFVSTGVYHAAAVTMTGGDEPRRLRGASFSADMLPTLGVSPLLGRGFTPDDDRAGAAETVILSYRLWQSEFGGSPTVIGRTMTLDNRPFTVIGVMPRQFNFPDSGTLFWTANRFGERDYAPPERTNNWVYAIGRLKDDVALERAQAEMSAIAAQSQREYPVENKDTDVAIARMTALTASRPRLLLIALSGAAACVLLIACANLANLLLARALERRQELAIRTAIGAGRERLVRQLLTESLVIAGCGGALGVLLAVIAVPVLSTIVPNPMPIAAAPAVDGRVLLVALTLTFLTGVVFGAAPLVRPDSNGLAGLREGARAGKGGKERLRSALVIVEIVSSIVLLASAGLLLRALFTVQRVNPGFVAEQVLTLRAELPMPQYGVSAKREAFYGEVLGQVRALPGVRAAGFVSFLPLSSMRGGIWPVTILGDTSAPSDTRRADNVAAIRLATAGYFGAMGIPLLKGRDISDADGPDRVRIAVVSESFVRRYFGDGDPIGRHFDLGGLKDREIVGVVGNVLFRGLEGQSEPQVYLPVQQDNVGFAFYAPRSLAIRTTSDPAALTPTVRAIIHRAEPTAPITEVRTMIDLVDSETASRVVQVRVLSAFAAIAFILAAIGIHSLLSFVVSQRTNEIGVRMALGAQARDILWMVMARGVVLTGAGVVPGLFLAYAAGRSMEALLAGVPPADATTLGAALALSVLMTLIGTLAPASRALRITPNAALRTE